jgi:hypothetical protein
MAFLSRILNRLPPKRELTAPQGVDGPIAQPDKESAAAAVQTLRAELEMIERALDALDQKAALVPAALGAIAGLLVPSGSPSSLAQGLLLLGGLVSGLFATVFALVLVLRARYFNVGPDAQTAARYTYLSPADYNRAVAGSLADSIDAMSITNRYKSRWLNRSIYLLASTIVFLALARAAGGMTTVPDPQQSTPQQTPTTQPTQQQPQQQSPHAEVPTDFGQQVVQKGGLPPQLGQRVNEIDKLGERG